jgi:hypothetical protein
MRSARTFREPAAEQKNPRLGKRLGDEIYVASEQSATPLRNYAPQSNFSAVRGVSLPWTRGRQMLSSPEFPLLPSCPEAIHPTGRIAAKHLISGGFSS